LNLKPSLLKIETNESKSEIIRAILYGKGGDQSSIENLEVAKSGEACKAEF
jgi:hypothetical protein